MSDIVFRDRWKQVLEAKSDEGTLIFELTMGVDHVYFPDETRWQAMVPAWAKGQQARYLAACQVWCVANRIPITVTGDAHVFEER